MRDVDILRGGGLLFIEGTFVRREFGEFEPGDWFVGNRFGRRRGDLEVYREHDDEVVFSERGLTYPVEDVVLVEPVNSLGRGAF